MNNPHTRLIEVYRAKNLPEAHAIRLHLADFGITVFIDGETLQGAIGELPMGWGTAPRIKVEESQVAAASAVIQKMQLALTDRGSDNTDGDVCLSCGQPMSPNVSVCSSCGWSYLGIDNAR